MNNAAKVSQMTLQRSKSRMPRCGAPYWTLAKICRPFCIADWEAAKKLRMYCSASQFEPWNGHRTYGMFVPCGDGSVGFWPA